MAVTRLFHYSKVVRTLTLATLLIALSVGQALAAVVYVDINNNTGIVEGTQANPFTSIQSAIDFAQPFDRVEVAAGTYNERIALKNGVSVIGAGAATTILDGTGTQNPVVSINGVQNNPRLEGFTITGGSGDRIADIGNTGVFAGGGILVIDSAPVIRNNVITNNNLTEGICRGAGIYVVSLNESPQILNNVIANNTAVSATDPGEGEGGGIYIEMKNAPAIIAENLIEMNAAVEGGGIWSRTAQNGSVSIQRNVIQFNDARNGAAIRSRDFTLSSTIIVNNLVRGNGSTAGVNDCDDADATRSPELPELCNDLIDNDCNGATPDIFDGDSDGFTCDLDCDDSDAAIRPSAIEDCLDGIDNDCDGAIDRHDPDNVVLVEQGSPMVYLDNSADPGLALTWVDPLFDDSAWTAGVYGVGFETAPPGAENLTTTVVATDAASVYTRSTFQISSAASVSAMFVAADYDDGYVVWINGSEVFRSPEMAPGDPTWNANPDPHESSNDVTPDYGVLQDISLAALGLLVDGSNSLAIGVYNDAPGTGSDLVLVPRLSMAFGLEDDDCTLCPDADGDGYACGDCNDADPAVHPAAAEVCNDAIDNDCDPATPDIVDADGDTFSCAIDCDDSDASVSPSSPEVNCDGVDNDCNPGTPDVADIDGDFFDCTVDCNDTNPAIGPAVLEFCFDGIDNNCDGFIDDADNECACGTPTDNDSDGYRCSDCDDSAPAVNPGANELCNDGIDNDCSSLTPDIFDADNDGTTCDLDCNDFDPAISQSAIEICNDGIDNDCDMLTDLADTVDCGCGDGDGDGYSCSDCNDGVAEINPGMAEICNDGIDNDCDAGTVDLLDNDGDGFDCIVDCNDSDPLVNTSRAEVCNDGIDNDCDTFIDLLSPDVVLVEFGSSMRYLAADVDPGIGITWVVEAFNDNPWTNGLFGVGYQVGPPGTGADNLIVTDVPDGSSFVYTRAKFNITDVAGVNQVTLGADYDDAYVAWINGVEVFRSPEMPAGEPVWNADPALHESSNGLVPDYGTLNDISVLAIPALHSGENTLAIGLYNDFPDMGGVSSDLVVVPRLSMSYGSDDPDCLCPDLDGDGFAGGACAVDCDDSDPNINPGQPEIGCDTVDNDCDGGTADILDGDGDGFDCDVDCVDNNPLVFPGGTEIPCDVIDNDCDSMTPDITDVDGDNYDCILDCDDNDSEVNPSASEVFCDGKDNDCDTLTPDIVDQDVDGFRCGVDCNDLDPAVRPDAAEHCTDTIDNDCDTFTDGADDECICADADGDGYQCLDCNDGDPAINPGMDEVCNDGIDNDCNVNTVDLIDKDQDGFNCLNDCNDDDRFIRPNAPEICNDGIDNDCDPATLDVGDNDGDLFACDVDCDDSDAAVNPAAFEVCNDSIDNDCDPGTLDVVDMDSDTFDCVFDCDDLIAAINPGVEEICNDGIDNDCNPQTADVFDTDNDGFDCTVDCNDADPLVFPGAPEHCNDTIDNDCDLDTDGVDVDCSGCPDGDGDFYACADCNDGNAAVNPGQVEVCNDTLDNDCDPATEDLGDVDGDGFACDLDCDDTDAAVNPSAAEVCNDAIDNDCNGATPDLFDADADTHLCDVDCDDDNPDVNPGAAEIGCDGIDNDCDPVTSDLADIDLDGANCADPTVRGAGISAFTSSSGTVSIVNNTIVDNVLANGVGGGLSIDDLTSTVPGVVANNIVDGNSAFLGAGIDHTFFFGELKSNTFFNNTGGDLYDGGGSGATKTDNRFVDPRFASSVTGNYRLDSTSPLIDAADDSLAPLVDIDRVPRPFDGDEDMIAVSDVGAYEFPSAEVLNVVFVSRDAMTWDNEPGSLYNVYRGVFSTLRASGVYTQTGPLPEQTCGVTAASLPFTDAVTPNPGGMLFFMVTNDGLAFEGTLGQDSSGRLRPNDNPCM